VSIDVISLLIWDRASFAAAESHPIFPKQRGFLEYLDTEQMIGICLKNKLSR
jgi:hypothetical protein